MKKEFWIEKWQNKQTGFHKEFTHPLLMEYISYLKINIGDTLFVPLCGKTVDMVWLNSQGYKVLGNELSQLAVEQFFTENNLAYEKHNDGVFNVYIFENITIYQGDFFDLTTEYTKNIAAVYDRAALIALPEGLIDKYVDHMSHLVPENTVELLITLELQRATSALGPPFSVSDSKVKGLFLGHASIEMLQVEDIIQREAGFQKQGCEYVYERVYLIKH